MCKIQRRTSQIIGDCNDVKSEVLTTVNTLPASQLSFRICVTLNHMIILDDIFWFVILEKYFFKIFWSLVSRSLLRHTFDFPATGVEVRYRKLGTIGIAIKFCTFSLFYIFEIFFHACMMSHHVKNIFLKNNFFETFFDWHQIQYKWWLHAKLFGEKCNQHRDIAWLILSLPQG